MSFRLWYKIFRQNAEREIAKEESIPEHQDLEQILSNEKADIESIRVRYDYEQAVELAPDLSQNLRAESTESIVRNRLKEGIKKDRFTLGLVSGIIAAISMTLLNYVIIFTTPSHNRYADFVGILLYGTKPSSSGEIIVSTISHFFMGGILGIIFVYLLLLISERYILIKGITYGTAIFFFLFSLGVIFNITGLEFTPLRTDTRGRFCCVNS